MVPYSIGHPAGGTPDPKYKKLFAVGDTLTCCDNSITKVISLHGDTFLCDDGIYRYDREYFSERGRVTGTNTWPPHPKTIAEHHPLCHPKQVVAALASLPKIHRITSYTGGKVVYDSESLMRQVCENLDKIFEFESRR